jgi:hypothetical protein
VFVAGVVLTCGYNLELFGGRLHSDVTFAAAWGALPVLTGYYAQAEALRLPNSQQPWRPRVVGGPTLAQQPRSDVASIRARHRRLRHQRRRPRERLSTASLLPPLEAALKAPASTVVALAVALTIYRATTP